MGVYINVLSQHEFHLYIHLMPLQSPLSTFALKYFIYVVYTEYVCCYPADLSYLIKINFYFYFYVYAIFLFYSGLYLSLLSFPLTSLSIFRMFITVMEPSRSSTTIRTSCTFPSIAMTTATSFPVPVTLSK